MEEFEKKYKEMNEDLDFLIDIFIDVVEASNGEPSGKDNRILDANGLAVKYWYHLLSISYLLKGINLNTRTLPIKNFIDPVSIDVLVRAAFETSLVFHYIFLNPEDDEQQDLIHYSWVAAKLYQRQNFPYKEKEHLEKIKKEQKDLACIIHKL